MSFLRSTTRSAERRALATGRADATVTAKARALTTFTAETTTIAALFALVTLLHLHRHAFGVLVDLDGQHAHHVVTEPVMVELVDLGSATKMTMTHVGVPAGSPGGQGWTMAIDKLAAHVADLGGGAQPGVARVGSLGATGDESDGDRDDEPEAQHQRCSTDDPHVCSSAGTRDDIRDIW